MIVPWGPGCDGRPPRNLFLPFRTPLDIPAAMTRLALGTEANGGHRPWQALGPTKYGVRRVNDYTHWFTSDSKTAGDYDGYDGPGPGTMRSFIIIRSPRMRWMCSISGCLESPLALRLEAKKGHVFAKGEGPHPIDEALRVSLSALLSELAEAPSSGTDSGRSTCCVDRSSELAEASALQASPGSPAARVAGASARSGAPRAPAGVLVPDAAQAARGVGQVPEGVRVPDVGRA